MSIHKTSTQWSLFALVAQIVRTVASLAAATAAAHGRLGNVEQPGVETLLDDAVGQLDALLMLGTHFSILAAELESTSGEVQRVRRKLRSHEAAPHALEEIRELIAAMRQEGSEGPSTERDGSLAAPGEQTE